MASFDAATDSVVVRIVYDGPPAAGKTTSLQALAGRFGQGGVLTPEATESGRTLYFDWLEYTGGRFEGRPIRCQIVTVPGQSELSPRRNWLLDTADAVVFVGDTSPAGIAESRAHLAQLLAHLKARARPPVGVVLQANKRDITNAVPLHELRGEHRLAIIESVAAQGDGIREAFVFAVRLALDRLRELKNQGALAPTDPEDSAERTLKRLKSIPIDDGARTLWPLEAPEQKPVETEALQPHTPDSAIPSGWVWPPINGRILLQEATRSPVNALRELGPGEWLGDTADGWRFHSPAASVFTDAEAARAALIRWAHVHAALSEWTSPARCIALCETGAGSFRLWQIIRRETSLWKHVVDALSSPDAERKVQAAASQCERVAETWPQAPYELPCTLETVGTDGVFISLVPDATHIRAMADIDHRHKLRQQLAAIVNTHQLSNGSLKSPALTERGSTFEATAANSVSGSMPSRLLGS